MAKKSAKKAVKKVAKKAVKKPAKKQPAKKKSAPKAAAKPVKKKKPMNMVSNEALVGKGRPDEAVPAIAKKVATKNAAVGKAKTARVPVRTGVAGGRPGGGGTGELAPARDTASGRGHGAKRKKR